MKQNNVLYLTVGCAMMLASCSQTPNTTDTTAIAKADRPQLEYSDADRTFIVVLDITSDSLMICNNNFSGEDKDPLILDTSNPAFPDFLSNWFASMDSVEITRLKNGSELHISARNGVTDATIEKVKSNVRKCGINGMSISNF